MGGTEIGCDIEPFGDLVDDDNLRGTRGTRHGGGVDTQPARALDDDGVAQPHVAQREQHLGQRTIERRDGLVGEVLGHLVQRLPPAGVVVLAVCGDEVRRLVVGAVFAGHQVLARVGPPPRARMTLSAGPKVGRHHPVADRQRLAGRVGGQSFAEFGYLADHLVAHGERTRQWQLTAEDVQVGSADPCHPQLQRRGSRRGCGERKFGQLDRTPGRGQ